MSKGLKRMSRTKWWRDLYAQMMEAKSRGDTAREFKMSERLLTQWRKHLKRGEVREILEKAYWLNWDTVIAEETEKPCHKLEWCPYGDLVEAFPLRRPSDKHSCDFFGHDCPAFYHREDVLEEQRHPSGPTHLLVEDDRDH